MTVQVGDPVPLPTGRELFERMSKQEQDEQFGPAAAEAVRSGKIGLADLVGHSEMSEGEDFITQRPLKDALPDQPPNTTQEVNDGSPGG